MDKKISALTAVVTPVLTDVLPIVNGGDTKKITLQQIKTLFAVGSGTVTSVSVATNQGVSGSVANPTTTPAITLTLGALTGVTSFNGLVVTANTGDITTGTWSATAIGATKGGTGLTSYTVGDMLYASTTTALSKLAAGAAGTYLRFNGAGAAPIVSTNVLPNTTPINQILFATFANVIGGSTTFLTDGTYLIVGGTALIGTEVLSLQKNQNNPTSVLVRNTDGGAIAYSEMVASNGTASNAFGITGTGVSGGAVFGTANAGYTGTSGVGGLSIYASNAAGTINFYLGGSASGNLKANFNSSGRLFIGGSTSATALLHLAAGTATANTAPLKFTSGTSLTTAVAGAMEFTTDNLFFTITTGAARKRLLMADDVSGLTSGKIPKATTNGRLANGVLNDDGQDITFAANTSFFTTGNSGGAITFDNSAGQLFIGNNGVLQDDQSWINFIPTQLNIGFGLTHIITLDSSGAGITTSSDFSVTASGDIVISSSNINLTSAGVLSSVFLRPAAGTATAGTSPLKFASGTNLTTAEAGAMEYDGTNLFFTRTGTTREGVLTQSAVTTESLTSDRSVTVNIGGTTYKLLAKS